jgi:hypothetical protein
MVHDRTAQVILIVSAVITVLLFVYAFVKGEEQ